VICYQTPDSDLYFFDYGIRITEDDLIFNVFQESVKFMFEYFFFKKKRGTKFDMDVDLHYKFVWQY
jgi:hypothetical protein